MLMMLILNARASRMLLLTKDQLRRVEVSELSD